MTGSVNITGSLSSIGAFSITNDVSASNLTRLTFGPGTQAGSNLFLQPSGSSGTNAFEIRPYNLNNNTNSYLFVQPQNLGFSRNMIFDQNNASITIINGNSDGGVVLSRPAGSSESRLTSGPSGLSIPGILTFYTSGSERVRIDSSGSLLVGTTTNNGYTTTINGANRNTYPSGALYVTGSSSFTGSINVSGGITGSLFGTASQALTASYILGGVSAQVFPYSGSAQITGSLGITGSLNVTLGITGSLFGTASYARSSSYAYTASSAISSSYPINISGSTLYLSDGSITNFSATDGIFLGTTAGYQATNAFSANFLGNSAGYAATNAFSANFLGNSAGYAATNANNSNFLGASAGYVAIEANNSNFLGTTAGYQATSASNSNFLGANAGYIATNASNSNFLGTAAGYSAVSSSYSNLIGFQAGANSNVTDGIGRNNIIIGTNITLPDKYQNGINIGGIIFGSGSYFNSNINIEPFSGSTNGRIGINKPTPNAALDVSGSVLITGSLNVSGGITGSLFGTASQALTASYLLGGGGSGVVFPYSGSAQITGSLGITGSLNVTLGITGSLFGTASQAVTASYALYAAGGSASAILYQTASAAFTWSFNHFLQTQYPVFAIYDSGNNIIIPQRIQAVDTSSALIYFSSPTTGVAVASKGGYSSSVVISATTANTAISASFASSGTGTFSGSFSGSFSGVHTGSLFGTASQAVSASYAFTASYALTASQALTASYVNTLNQNVLITGSLTIGSASLGVGENTLVIGPAPAGGLGEGGQLLLSAKGGGYDSASMLDTYQNRFRVLRGTNVGSTAEVLSANLNTNQIAFTSYNSVGAFPGTAVANLAVDSGGNILTVTAGSSAGFPYSGSAQITGSLGVTGSLTVSGSMTIVGRSTATDLTGSLFGTASQALTASYAITSNVAYSGTGSFTGSFIGVITGSLFGTASQALTASYILGGVSAQAFPYSGSAQITGSLGVSGSVNITSGSLTLVTGSLTLTSASLTYQQNLSVAAGGYQVIASAATASYRAAFFDYVMFSGSIVRGGTVTSTWSGSVTEYYENYTADLGGSTSGVTLQTALSTGNIQLQASASTAAWTIRSLIRLL
jgi:hypothetical protein